MELRPGFRRTEIGVFPDNWEVVYLGDKTTKVGSGITPTGGEKVYKPEGRPFLRSQNVGWGSLLLGDVAYIDQATHETFAGTEIQVGDVFLNITGASIGRSAIADSRVVGGNVNQHVCIIRVNQDQIDPRFLNRVLLSDVGQRQIDSFQAGGNRQGLNFGQICSFRVPAPPILEQHAIAAALSDVDALLSKLDQVIAKKRDVKQGAMHDLLAGTKRLPGFTGKWPEKHLGELFTFSGGYTASRAQLSSEGLCYLHYGDIHTSSRTVVDTRADFASIPKLNIPLREVPSKSLLDDGDVVFVDASEDDEGTSKHIVVTNKNKVPFISGLHTIVAKSRTDELIHEYRRYCFQAPAIKKQFLFYAVGTKVSGISKTNIAKLILPVPTAAEQAAIAAILADMDAEIAALEARRNKTSAIKQGMTQELMSGRIRLP